MTVDKLSHEIQLLLSLVLFMFCSYAMRHHSISYNVI